MAEFRVDMCISLRPASATRFVCAGRIRVEAMRGGALSSITPSLRPSQVTGGEPMAGQSPGTLQPGWRSSSRRSRATIPPIVTGASRGAPKSAPSPAGRRCSGRRKPVPRVGRARSEQQELGSAESLKAQAAKQAMQLGSNALSQFGIQLPSSGNTQEAIQKGALAATNPQMQNAIMIQLLSANTHLQEMIWRGCKPSSG